MCQVFQNNDAIVLNANSANMAYRICNAGIKANIMKYWPIPFIWQTNSFVVY